MYACVCACPSTGHQLELEKLAQLENVRLERQIMESSCTLPHYVAHRAFYLKISDMMYLLLNFLETVFSLWQLVYLWASVEYIDIAHFNVLL